MCKINCRLINKKDLINIKELYLNGDYDCNQRLLSSYVFHHHYEYVDKHQF